MLLSFMLTVTFILVDCKIHERHVPNTIEPQQIEEAYNLNDWIGGLHLQQCAFVAIGENYFAIFLERTPRPFDDDQEIKDYFIGICDLDNLKKWKLCPAPVELKRPEDCVFATNLQQSPRVHRRLCELSDLTSFASRCNCEGLLRGEKLYNVVGFPTCFRPQIEAVLCGYNNVCGLNPCKMFTVANRVYGVKCDENCFGHKPFCESPEWQTAKPREISSFWSDWSDSECTNPECLSLSSEAKCINKDTGRGDVDCLGPGTSCCPKGLENCKCHVFIENGMSKILRIHTVQPIPDYEEISLEEFIKNLPLKNEHRQAKPKVAMKRKSSHRGIRDIDTYDCCEQDFLKSVQKHKGRMSENEEDEDYEGDDIKDIEKDEEENGEDDIMIEEDIVTTSSTVSDEDIESRNVQAIQAFHEVHKNESIVDVPDRNSSKPGEAGRTLGLEIFLIKTYMVLFCLINFGIV